MSSAQASQKNAFNWLIWLVISVLGAVALGVVALSRSEPVNAIWIVTAAVCTYLIAFRFYSLFITRSALRVQATAITEAASIPMMSPAANAPTAQGNPSRPCACRRQSRTAGGTSVSSTAAMRRSFIDLPKRFRIEAVADAANR